MRSRSRTGLARRPVSAVLVGVMIAIGSPRAPAQQNAPELLSSAELRRILTNPASSSEETAAKLLRLGGRTLTEDALEIGLEATKTADAIVLYALSGLLIQSGETERIKALEALWGIAQNPRQPYGRWVVALGMVWQNDRAGYSRRKAELLLAWGKCMRDLEQAPEEIEEEFFQVLGRSPFRFARRFTSRNRDGVRYFARQLQNGNPEISLCALRILSRATRPHYIPPTAIPALVQRAELVGDQEAASLAQITLARLIGSNKPVDLPWPEWRTRFGSHSKLLAYAMSRALNGKLDHSVRFHAMQLALSLSVDLGEKAFTQNALRLLRLARDEGETDSFRGSAAAYVNYAIRADIDAGVVEEDLARICKTWLEGKRDAMRNVALGLYGTAAPSDEIRQELLKVLGDTAEPFWLRAQAADSLRRLGMEDTVVKKEILRSLIEAEAVAAGQKSTMILRHALGALTGVPSNTSIESWQKLLTPPEQ